MQKDNNKPLGAEKHLLAGAIAGKRQTIFYNSTCILYSATVHDLSTSIVGV